MNLCRMEVSFFRHRSKKAGYATLYCRISVNGDRVDIGSTGITIYFDDWDAASEKTRERDPEAQFKNEKLLILKLHLGAIFNDLFRMRGKITAGKIKRIYLSGQTNISLLGAFDLYLKDCKTDRERDLNKNSISVYDNVRKKLISFLISEKALDIPLEDFGLDWLKKFSCRWPRSDSPGSVPKCSLHPPP